MEHSVARIAEELGATFQGNGDLTVTDAAEPGDAGEDSLALAMNPKYAGLLSAGKARAALVWEGADWHDMGLEAAIFVPHGKLAMAGVTGLMDPGPDISKGVHPSAVISQEAKIGPDCAIGPFTVIGPGVRIGTRARIDAHVTVSSGAILGDDALILAGVRICSSARIGDRVILHPNVVIGADGFSFVTPEPSSVERVRGEFTDMNEAPHQKWTRVHSLGLVELGDDVEVGALSSVDRGTIRATRVGRGTKIDNLVQVGHNVTIGEDCMICSQVGIAGSARIGNRVVLAGRVAVNDNIFVGDDVVAAGAAKLFTNVPTGRVMMGDPATKLSTQLQINKALRRLPRLFRDVADLQKAVSKTGQKD